VAKTSSILQALSLLGPEEILKLSELHSESLVQLKKAAGEDLIVWNDPPEKQEFHKEEAKVLAFPIKKSVHDFSELPAPEIEVPPEDDSENSSLVHSELVLWQREVNKGSDGAIKKLGAFKGYLKSTQMYVVKNESAEGNSKIRFASTDGILVNKKQA
jgi:hypothetical protein